MHGKQLRSKRYTHTHAFILGPNLRGLEDCSQDMFLSHLEPFALLQTLERSNNKLHFPQTELHVMHLKNAALGLLNTRLRHHKGFQSIHQGKHWISQVSRDHLHNLSTHQRERERARPGPIETTYPAGRSSADHAVVYSKGRARPATVFSRHTERN